MRVKYICYYDGKECNKAIPKFDEKGNLIPEPNTKIKEKYGHFLSERYLDECWDVCDKCDRNCTIGGCCYGKLAIDDGEKK